MYSQALLSETNLTHHRISCNFLQLTKYITVSISMFDLYNKNYPATQPTCTPSQNKQRYSSNNPTQYDACHIMSSLHSICYTPLSTP